MEHLPKKLQDNGLLYTLVGEHYIPELTLPVEQCPIVRWGRLYREYLEQTNPMLLNDLILTCKLWIYLADLNEQAKERLECIIQQLKTAEGITEELKACDQLAWVRDMNSIRNRTEEIICHEIIYTEEGGI